ncbi:MAG: SGNH hydrolase domain-containing protein, partial [Burkholderiaceae bacterium]
DYCHVIATLFPKNADLKYQKQCRDSLLAIQDWMESQSRQIDVLVAIRWFLQGYPYSWIDEPPYFDNGANGIEAHPGVEVLAINKKTGVMSSEFVPKKQAIVDFIDYLITWGESVTIIGPVPEVGWDVGDYLFMSLLRNGRKPDSISTSFDRYVTRNKFYNDIFSNLAAHTSNVWFIDPSEIFCNLVSFENQCVALIDEDTFYFDDDHLSYLGASKLIESVISDTPIFNLKTRDE